MNIRRAAVSDEGEKHVFHSGPEPGSHVWRAIGPHPVSYGRKMWTNAIGLHVSSGEGDNVWTVYPLHTVLWMEEVRQ